MTPFEKHPHSTANICHMLIFNREQIYSEIKKTLVNCDSPYNRLLIFSQGVNPTKNRLLKIYDCAICNIYNFYCYYYYYY